MTMIPTIIQDSIRRSLSATTQADPKTAILLVGLIGMALCVVLCCCKRSGRDSQAGEGMRPSTEEDFPARRCASVMASCSSGGSSPGGSDSSEAAPVPVELDPEATPAASDGNRATSLLTRPG